MLTGLSLTEELLRLAAEIEENGWNFYSALAKQTQDGDISDKFIYLAAQMEIGITMEKDSILFYSEISSMLPGDDRIIINGIIGEEQKHLSELTYIKRQLLKV